MSVTQSELRELVTKGVKNYPDLNQLVTEDVIVKKGTWYEVRSKDAFDALINYATAVRTEGTRTLLKVPKQSKSSQKLAGKCLRNRTEKGCP